MRHALAARLSAAALLAAAVLVPSPAHADVAGHRRQPAGHGEDRPDVRHDARRSSGSRLPVGQGRPRRHLRLLRHREAPAGSPARAAPPARTTSTCPTARPRTTRASSSSSRSPAPTPPAPPTAAPCRPPASWSTHDRRAGRDVPGLDRAGNVHTVDCRKVTCGVITVGAHGVTNANNETFTPGHGRLDSARRGATPSPSATPTERPRRPAPTRRRPATGAARRGRRAASRPARPTLEVDRGSARRRQRAGLHRHRAARRHPGLRGLRRRRGRRRAVHGRRRRQPRRGHHAPRRHRCRAPTSCGCSASTDPPSVSFAVQPAETSTEAVEPQAAEDDDTRAAWLFAGAAALVLLVALVRLGFAAAEAAVVRPDRVRRGCCSPWSAALLLAVPALADDDDREPATGQVAARRRRPAVGRQQRVRATAPSRRGTYNFFSAGQVPDPGKGGDDAPAATVAARAPARSRSRSGTAPPGSRPPGPGCRPTAAAARSARRRPARFSNHRFVFGGGTGTVDAAAGTAHVAWDGDRHRPLLLRDVVLLRLRPGPRRGRRQRHPHRDASAASPPRSTTRRSWAPVAAAQVTLADLPDVTSTDEAGSSTTPAYLGVARHRRRPGHRRREPARSRRPSSTTWSGSVRRRSGCPAARRPTRSRCRCRSRSRSPRPRSRSSRRRPPRRPRSRSRTRSVPPPVTVTVTAAPVPVAPVAPPVVPRRADHVGARDRCHPSRRGPAGGRTPPRPRPIPSPTPPGSGGSAAACCSRPHSPCSSLSADRADPNEKELA